MATLAGNTIASTYPLLLKIDSSGIDGTLRAIQDGDATDSAVKISTGAMSVDGNVTITTTDNSDNIALVSTDADANSGPNLSFWRNSGSPADNDLLGQINWYAENDADEKTHMAQFYVTSMDVSDGTEDVRFVIQTILGGATETSRIELLPSETVINQDSKDIDFRVESDGNANMLVVDASANAVGIGTASPAGILDVQGGRTHLKSSDEYNLRLYASNGDSGKFIGTPAGDKLSIYSDVGNAEVTVDASGNVGIGVSSPADVKGLHIKSDTDSDFVMLKLEADSTTRDASMSFITSGGNTFSMGIDASDSDKFKISDNTILGTNDRLVINSSGDVGIGDSAPGSALTNFGSASKGLSIKNGQPTIALTDTDTGSGALYIANGGGISYFQNTVSGSTFRFYVESTIALEIENDGVLKSSDGIEFEGTALGSGQTGIASSGDGGDLRMYTNGAESWNFDSNGNLVGKNQSNGKAYPLKFAGSATYGNNGFTSHSIGASGAIVLITNHTNDSSALFHMDYDHSTITMIANPGGVDSDGFNNADSGDTIRVTKSAGSFSFTVKNSTGGDKAIGIGIISMHES